ncbi:MAG TPA: NAD(P)/FAD-dependent oxidoreductase [Opitutaceae bacterium]|nr:NAD(P)/FAD-dependent oxidoreductase [Opitutaceae bacterium]
MPEPLQIAIVGGGAAGFFAAITCAEALGARGRVTIFEATLKPLTKVRISGGGRCNVTNARTDPRELVAHYPRGGRELLGPFHRFGPRETIAWYDARGVPLVTQPDLCLFPVSDNSATVIDCLLGAARAAGVTLRTQSPVKRLAHDGARFALTLGTGETFAADRVLLATGGAKGLDLAAALGHRVEPPVPSLFTFRIADPRCTALAGIVLEEAVASVPGTRLQGAGPLLFTHEGLSGPAILRLSAWGARELAAREYKFTVALNFVPPLTTATAAEKLGALRATHGRKQLHTWSPLELPQRLWEQLVAASGARAGVTWAEAPAAVVQTLARLATASEFPVSGKAINRDEFVTCGGVSLREVDFRTMQSRVRPGLFFAGEVLDIDGLTGGFNFQAAWTTGWHAGTAMAAVE